MPVEILQIAEANHAWGSLNGLIATDGTRSHPLATRLATTLMPMRDLADAIHFLCMLHGRHPGVMDHAVAHSANGPAAEWTIVAAEAFAEERAYLIRLVAAAGPLPSTAGQAQCDIAVEAQRRALDMLAQSDRIGCAPGAAIALALDWSSIREVLDVAAERLGVSPASSSLPPTAETAAIVAALAGEAPVERAMLFGVRQLLAQHRGLWDLLEARASARRAR